MKKIVLTAFAVTFLLTVKAQSVAVTAKDTGKIYTSVERAPVFPGGIQQFYNYLGSNTHYPEDARAKNQQGRVIVTMTIERDGSLTGVRVVRGVSASLDQEALRVISASPKWSPGILNGQAVRCQYTVPIAFTLSK
ncbi:energy transducer TonB [Mucilaginibacter sp. X4EP1]|uniref:energy transducer TonB n=1 Tax=Mucilaginibacter sp. X4EP1 TaxID=2723092 RepID=UPI00216718EE|nr:energy transducer TonB [Mucilaginibacter sp. X4EP1]MCS3814863.1 TonB family protein [Mucilaginibacter sp. X4EP1]